MPREHAAEGTPHAVGSRPHRVPIINAYGGNMIEHLPPEAGYYHRAAPHVDRGQRIGTGAQGTMDRV